ncbi:SDR family NAD(P)-dependent oxidoreductase (plasmid) [Tistrella bauzanensis]|uniref:SDR family NAD(P)-dependent oxidoreductase n=1 Tax=Tistrella arctica TaxID=3133430 RepID=A0ABU9YLR1_9PROT
MSTVLITGGAGFIGRHVCTELLRAGHRVRVLDSLIEQAHGPSPSPAGGLPAAVEFILGDVRDPAAVTTALDGADAVINLASDVGVGQSMYEIDRYVSVNTLGSAVLMQQVVNSGVRKVIVASSMSVYGEGLYLTPEGAAVEDVRRTAEAVKAGRWDPVMACGRPLIPAATPETKRPDLASIYALTKFDQEQMTLILGAAYGIEAVSLRLFNTFGPGQMLSNPYTGVLAIFAGRLLNGQSPMVFEDGEQHRDFVHVRDVARAFRLALETPGLGGEILNIASGRIYTVSQVARLLAGAMDREDLAPQILQKSRVGDVRHCFADITRARARLGFQPELPLEDTVLELVDWVSTQRAQDRVRQAHQELETRGLVV